MSLVKSHFKDNSGDGYIWFLSILVITLILFAAIFNILDTSIAAKNVRTEIDAAAEDVYADIRETAYDTLTQGTTAQSFTSYSNVDVAEMFAAKLNADSTLVGISPVITKTSSSGQTLYTITDFSFTYVDNTDSPSATYHTYKVGDINRDNTIDGSDLSLAENIFETRIVPDGCFWLDLDINKDGIVEEKDIELLGSIVEYYSSYDQTSHYTTSVSLLIISFRMETPIKFANFDFGTSNEMYSYTTSLTFKPA